MFEDDRRDERLQNAGVVVHPIGLSDPMLHEVRGLQSKPTFVTVESDRVNSVQSECDHAQEEERAKSNRDSAGMHVLEYPDKLEVRPAHRQKGINSLFRTAITEPDSTWPNQDLPGPASLSFCVSK